MSQGFMGKDLKKESFIKQNLDGKNFDKSDIRGVDFSEASLVEANFKGAIVGVAPLWFYILFSSLLLLVFFSGLIIAYASFAVVSPLENSSFDAAIETFISSLAAIVSILIMVTQGLGTLLVTWIVSLAGLISIIGALVQYDHGSIAEYVVVKIIVTNIGVAGVISGIIVGSVIIVVTLIQGGLIETIVTTLVALLGFFLGITEGIGTGFSEEPLTWLFATSLISISLFVSARIGSLASQCDSRYSLIRTIAISFLNLKGTSFKGADLTNVDFSDVNLSRTNFSFAKLICTRWLNSKGLEQCLTRGTYLDNNDIRKLVVSGQGQNKKFDYLNLRGLNLEDANLKDASFIGADLSNSNLQNADLSRAKLAQAQLYNTRLSGAILTGACIEDWGISTDTQLNQVRCKHIYMHLPTQENPDPYRKPDNRDEDFQPGDFADFITPIIKTLALYKRQNIDLRDAATTYRTIDLFHHKDIDPRAIAIALRQLATQYPEACLEVLELESKGQDKLRLQAKISSQIDPSEVSEKYLKNYDRIMQLSDNNLREIEDDIEDDSLLQLLDIIKVLRRQKQTYVRNQNIYIESYQEGGNTVTEEGAININAGGDISNLSGIVGGSVSGMLNLGTISGNVTNAIAQLPSAPEKGSDLRTLLQQLQTAIEEENTISSQDKADALEQVQILAEAGQNPGDNTMQKAARLAMKVLQGTTKGLSETTNLVQECTKLLPAISSLLLLL